MKSRRSQLAVAALAAWVAIPSVSARDAMQRANPAAPPPVTDPFAKLRLLVPVDQLPPLRSVRIRRKDENEDKPAYVLIKTSPRARVYHGRKLLGLTPLRIEFRGQKTPLDLVIKAPGYMTLRTRVERSKARTYKFKLTPAKVMH